MAAASWLIPFEQLRATLLEINDSKQICMTSAVAGASHGKRLPEIQAIMARCRQSAAATVATAIDTFRRECSDIGAVFNADRRQRFLQKFSASQCPGCERAAAARMSGW